MPDNGFGNKANSRPFLLRVYTVRPDCETARGGRRHRDPDWINLRDPDHRSRSRSSTRARTERYLTGGDFDIESFRIDRSGTLWFGEEFGPFLLHTDATGKVLEAPIPLPGVRSPDYPGATRVGRPHNLNSSNGFEGMAISPDGRTLYPTLEGAVKDDEPTRPPHVRVRHREAALRGGDKQYRVADPSYLVSDLTALDAKRFVALERDNFQGAGGRAQAGFVRRSPRPSARSSTSSTSRDPTGSRSAGRPGDIGLGDPFKMPYVTIEAVLPDRRERAGDRQRHELRVDGPQPVAPDDSDFIRVKVPALRG